MRCIQVGGHKQNMFTKHIPVSAAESGYRRNGRQNNYSLARPDYKPTSFASNASSRVLHRGLIRPMKSQVGSIFRRIPKATRVDVDKKAQVVLVALRVSRCVSSEEILVLCSVYATNVKL